MGTGQSLFLKGPCHFATLIKKLNQFILDKLVKMATDYLEENLNKIIMEQNPKSNNSAASGIVNPNFEM